MRNVLKSIQTPADHRPPPDFRTAQGNGKPAHVPLSASQGLHCCHPIPDSIPGSNFTSLESLCNCSKGSWLRASSALPTYSADPMQVAPPWPSSSPLSPRKVGISVHLTGWYRAEMDTCPSGEDQTVLRSRPRRESPLSSIGSLGKNSCVYTFTGMTHFSLTVLKLGTLSYQGTELVVVFL